MLLKGLEEMLNNLKGWFQLAKLIPCLQRRNCMVTCRISAVNICFDLLGIVLDYILRLIVPNVQQPYDQTPKPLTR